MTPYTVRDLVCKSVINRVQGMPFTWSINPYRGCHHACVYCYARPTHEYLGLNGAEEFQEIIFAKVNAPELVRRELARRSWRGEPVAIGTATDPYQPAEARYQITRGILQAFRDFHNPVSITTKSPMILRDLDLLADLAKQAAVSVHMTVTTLDEHLWRAIEPATARPQKRLAALATLHAHGIRAGVFLSPILPGLTDDEEHLEAVVAGAAAAGVDFVWGQVLRLGPGFERYYLQFIEREYPHLREQYAAIYRGGMPPAAYRELIQARLGAIKQRYGLLQERTPVKEPSPAAPVQLPLFAAVG